AWRRLRRIAGPNLQFAGRLSDPEVARLLQSARALIVTSVEEFGIAAVEAQASGRPVIARRAGGALETVVDGVTGRLWAGGPDDLARAVLEFDDGAIDPEVCVSNANRFNGDAFRRGMLSEVAEAYPRGARAPTSERQPHVTTRLVRRAAARDQHR